MNEEDIYSFDEHESLLKNMKKKESKPLYLHLKGAFLTAMAIQESESAHSEANSLLSSGEVEKDINPQEKSNMDANVVSEDILAAVEDLSQDLSAIASGTVEESEETPAEEAPETEAPEVEEAPKEETANEEVPEAAEESAKGEEASDKAVVENEALLEAIQKILEDAATVDASTAAALLVANELNQKETADILTEQDGQHKKWLWQLKSFLKMEAGEPADESWRIAKSEEVSESAEELVVVDSANPEVSKEDQEEEVAKAELTGNESASEENANASKLQSLEEENQKLKNALHRTLVERVVDAKIAAGVESQEIRESLIQEHVSRSASSLADSLRDLAKMPATKKIAGMMLEMNSEIEVIEGEQNVTTINGEEEVVEEKVTNTPEQLFVDALMGRRKL
jgi:hypothetical protein